MNVSMIMARNPEFMRHIWLEFSLHRVLGLPTIILLICLMTSLLNTTSSDHSSVASVALSMTVLLLLWGTHLAAESMLVEVRERTWNAQRMSALSPWQLGWGKLFGSTLFAWYGVCWCLLIYLISSPELIAFKLQLSLFIILFGLLSQAVTMLFCLHSIDRANLLRTQSFAYVMLVLVTIVPWLFAAMINIHQTVDWYGYEIAKLPFSIFSAALFLGWALAGIYRLMRQELQMRQGFFVWLGFELTLMVYLANFLSLPAVESAFSSVWIVKFTVAVVVALSLSYLMLLLEDSTAIDAKRWISAIIARRFDEAIQLTPCWLVSVCLTFLALVVLCLLPVNPLLQDVSISLILSAMFLFALRDIALLLWVRFRIQYKASNSMAMVVYLACSYAVLPPILSAIGMDYLIFLFLPTIEHAGLLLLPFIEAVLAFTLLYRRWRQVSLDDV